MASLCLAATAASYDGQIAHPATIPASDNIRSLISSQATLQPVSGKGDPIRGYIKNASFTNASVNEALETLVRDASLSVTVVGGAGRYGTISASNIRGEAASLVDELSDKMGFFYTVSNRNLIVSAEQSFTVSLADRASDADIQELIDDCQRLGARYLRKDGSANSLVFVSSKKAYLRISGYLAGTPLLAENDAGKVSPTRVTEPVNSPEAGARSPALQLSTLPVSEPARSSPVAAASPSEQWVIKNGSRLREVVREFVTRAGWVDVWNYKDSQTSEDKDLLIGGGMRVEGDLKAAITALFNALPASAKLKVELWPDNFPPTVYISREGADQ